MSRIEGIPENGGTPLQRFTRREAKRRMGGVMPEPFAVMAHHTATLLGAGAFEITLERTNAIDPHLSGLAQLKTATVIGCEFCCDIGSFVARTKDGADDEQIRELHRHAESPAFNDDERLVCDYAVAMTRTPSAVDDELFARLRARFDDRAIVALTAAIAWENWRARFNAALDIGPQGFSEGAACAVPLTNGAALETTFT